MEIRDMYPRDWARVRDIYAQGIRSGTATFTDRVPDYDLWDSAHCQVCRFVAVEDGLVVGWIAVSPTSAREPYRGVVEVSLYVDNGYHRRGIGRALMNRLMEACPEQGFWSIFSVILSANRASIALHEACGFRLIGYKERPARDRFGVWQDTTLMEKRL